MLCIGLVLLAGTLSVTHFHPDNALHPDCVQCVTAHATLQLVWVFAQVLLALVFVWVAANAVPIRVRTLFFNFALFTRPPPAVAYLS